jgi:endo-1,4-beta-xylanase
MRLASLLFGGLFAIPFTFPAHCQTANMPPLKNIAPFPVGVAVGYRLMAENAAYQGVVRTEMSSLTVENAQKWSGLHPAKDRFDFTQSDFIVDWARREGKRVHGHNLLWHSYNPAWLGTFEGDSLAWENLLKTHIQTVVAHFRGRVASWDVVNEAFTDDGRLRNVEPVAKDGSIWRQKLGPDYIARAFRYARQADPTVLLFYNDYGQENHPAKTQAILNMVADFKRRNVPIDGLGLQFHIGVSVPDANLRSVMEQFAATGLRVHISELDILASDWKKDSTLQYTDALQARQAAKYRFIAQTYRAVVPEAQQFGITTWNVGDGDSWIRKQGYTDWPLLFDGTYTRKKAFYGFAAGLR